jgi:spore germination protein
MDIYVVQTGDTINKIADSYGVSVDKLILDNHLTNPNKLVPGEVIIITYPSKTYTVKDGDSLDSIASLENVTVNELLRNNPRISDKDYIYPGEVLTISFNRAGKIATNGFTATFIDRQTLKKTLPYLTYLSIFNYRIIKNGDVVGNNDDIDIIQLSKEYGVIPLLHLASISVQGDIDFEVTFETLSSEELQNKLVDNIVKIIREKGYYGVNLAAQYITAANQQLYYNYTKRFSDRLRQEGLLTFITINPKIDTLDNEVIYEDIDYANFSSIVDSMVFIQYRWSIGTMPPAPLISIRSLNTFLDYILPQLASLKIFVGTPAIGYIWELPFVPGLSKSNALTIDNVINLARDVGATIQFDEVSQTPYINYSDSNEDFTIWFVNALTVNSLIKLLSERNVFGTAIWNIMTFFEKLWLVINCQYEIIKLLPEF